MEKQNFEATFRSVEVSSGLEGCKSLREDDFKAACVVGLRGKGIKGVFGALEFENLTT